MKAELAKAWLSSQGYRYDVDSDGDIHFKFQGKNMFCCVDDNDELFFNLIMPNIYTVENNSAGVAEACIAIARDIKVVKAFLMDDHLWLAIEMFIDTTPELDDFFERCCNLLVAAYDRVTKEILGYYVICPSTPIRGGGAFECNTLMQGKDFFLAYHSLGRVPWVLHKQSVRLQRKLGFLQVRVE